MWLPVWCQTPWVIGETGGIFPSSASDTDFEKVREIWVFGLIVPPGAGLATAAAAVPAGNQLTTVGPVVSHVRGTPETHTEPASAVRASVSRSLVGVTRWRASWAALDP